MKLRQDGYYISEGKKWEDWHAGHKEEGFTYRFIKINNDNTFYSHSKTDKKFDFINFLKQYSSIIDLKAHTSANHGKYLIEKENVKFDFKVAEKYPMQFVLRIIDSETLKDEKGILYRFKEVKILK